MVSTSQFQLSKSTTGLPVVELTEFLMRSHSNEFDYTQYLHETNKSYGYKNVVWPNDGSQGSSDEIGSNRKLFSEKQWKPLMQRSSVRIVVLSPYRYDS
ncbi:hypothetical protein V6N13_133816 [Hibiscus sabdariffa]|uniref:Uncharacterized protein n=1 Tax=Hibiscus sabdariffa TaxID=183260 RepID=A0ABR2R082_9ROSI